MKFWVILISLISLLIGGIVYAARFDWSLGQPVITDDNINTTNGIRYDWSLGQPTIVWTEPTSAAVGLGDGNIKVKDLLEVKDLLIIK